ncbi:MAG: hypothetical protein CFE37_00400 [Alphaproteobacteria bacterium PA4]|nr:MAG: hypothetical protein CFE37_00400 [Alphaproteobacteria bacterium PA4]
MDTAPTLALLATGLSLVLLAIVGDRARRRAPLAWHAHLPWNALAFLGVAALLLGAVHLLTLVKAGADFTLT